MTDKDEDENKALITPEEYRLTNDVYITNGFPDHGKLTAKAKLYRSTMGVDPDDLLGQVRSFYGAHTMCFKLDDVVFEVLEDPDDGYRSTMDMLIIHPNKNLSGFFDQPLAKVKLEAVEPNKNINPPLEGADCWKLVDIDDGHVWLEFGTKEYDIYYPYCTFKYTPKPPSE